MNPERIENIEPEKVSNQDKIANNKLFIKIEYEIFFKNIKIEIESLYDEITNGKKQ